jgi:Protein of unknown function (DUF3302)
MFLDYLALAILVLVVIAVFYAFIYIHDIPHEIAKKRNHPQTEAIHVACWLSLFTLHAIWPIVFIWAISKQKPYEVVVSSKGEADLDLTRRLSQLEDRLHKLEQGNK